MNNEISNFLIDTLPDKEKFMSGRFCYRAFDENRHVYTKYRLLNLEQASLVGTAFDYLARFEIAHKIKNKQDKIKCKDILAKDGIGLLWKWGYKKECRKAQGLYEWSMYVIDEYINGIGNHSDNKIIDICNFFAILEHLVRDHKTDEISMIGEKASFDVEYELKSMLESYRKYFVSMVSENSLVVYNPTFNCYKMADADIWIDGCLYDFKTTKNIGYNENEVKQLWWYVLLHEIDIMNHAIGEFQSYNIDKMALYKARCADIDELELDRDEVRHYAKRLELLLRKYKLYREVD